jgi:dimethylhistidine N-methyltransferase
MSIANEILLGLIHYPKTLSNLQWLHYDHEGSLIFEKILLQDEYYPTRIERSIFELNSDEIIAKVSGNKNNRIRIVELGAGTATKTSILLAAAVKYQGSSIDYFPVDISLTALAEAQSTLECLVPGVCIIPQIKNYITEELILPNFDGCTLAVYIGLSIGNFCREEAASILDHIHNQLKTGDALLISVDMCQDSTVLLSAYDDKNGVTAAFHFNVLRRLNRGFGYHFDLDQFQYKAVWNKHNLRVEKHIESLCSQQVKLIDQYKEEIIHFDKGETIHMEDSYKFTDEQINILLTNAGFQIEYIWNDEHKWINIILARISPTSF